MTDQADISVRTRLSIAYSKLTRSKLVLNHDTSDDALNYFVERLNEILPKTAEEREQSRIIKGLHYNNPNLLFKLLTVEKDGQMTQTMYLLWTNALSIVRHFAIIDVIRLDWDTESIKYKISIKPEEKSDSTQAPGEHKPTAFKKTYQTPRQAAGKDSYHKKDKYQVKKEKRFANKPKPATEEPVSPIILESESKNNSTLYKPASEINWADEV